MNQEAFEGVDDPQDLEPVARDVLEHVDLDHLTDRLTGRDGGLRPSKPTAQNDTGAEQYVWRMARFHSGADPRMPVMAEFDLRDWLESGAVDASDIMRKSAVGDGESVDTRSRGYKQVVAIMDVLARACVARLGANPGAGLARWEKALYG